MPPTTTARRAAAKQSHPKRTPPHVPIALLRTVAGLTIDNLIQRLHDETGHEYSRGTISAIENGHRGPSAELLESLAVVYGLPPGSITTDYVPRNGSVAAA